MVIKSKQNTANSFEWSGKNVKPKRSADSIGRKIGLYAFSAFMLYNVGRCKLNDIQSQGSTKQDYITSNYDAATKANYLDAKTIIPNIEKKETNVAYNVKSTSNSNLSNKIEKNPKERVKTYLAQLKNIEKKENREEKLDSIIKNISNNRIDNIILWDSTYTRFTKKYNIQEGLLAGKSGWESSANPLNINSTDDGGVGQGMFQPGTAKAFGLKVYGTSTKTGADHNHGKVMKKLIKENDTLYSKLRKLDERFDLEKSIEATAKYLSYNYKRFGSWNKAISAYNRGTPGKNYMQSRHNQGVRKTQLRYLLAKQEAGHKVDKQLVSDLKTITHYKH